MPNQRVITLNDLINNAPISDLPEMPVIKDISITTAKHVENDPEKLLAILSAGAEQLAPYKLKALDTFYKMKMKMGNVPFSSEIMDVDSFANGVAGAISLNFSLDLACSTGIYTTKEGVPSLVRLLDWRLKMSDVTTALTRHGRGGDWIDITYPGFTGTVTAIGPHFAAAINRAPMRSLLRKVREANSIHYSPPRSDNALSFIQALISRHVSPVHLLRQTFEESASFDEAVQQIVNTQTSCSVIIPIAGKTADEAAIIYKDDGYCAISTFPQGADRLRNLFKGRTDVKIFEENSLAAANHFPTGYGLRPTHTRRYTNSEGRVCAFEEVLSQAKYHEVFDLIGVSKTDVDGLSVVSYTTLAAEMIPATGFVHAVALQDHKPTLKPARFRL